MQDFIVNAALWITPDFAPSDRRTVDELAPYELDEASLAQFEALLPARQDDAIDASSTEEGSSGIAGVGARGSAGGAAASAFFAATSAPDAGVRSRDVRPPEPDAIVSSYTIHHARIGVVHVHQSTGGHGGVGALTLSTDDDDLRARLREAMPALREAIADGDGRGPDLSVDA
ncbi:hypothetical protein ACSFA3_04025 [Variovorax sp. RHLX14]|uniref:hypothetical protein n=1 Tax=Variovorax sp. RHLX14 TaxID=1259731 RepID=UPI003F48C82B